MKKIYWHTHCLKSGIPKTLGGVNYDISCK